MAHIKEPRGVDFFVENKVVTEEDRRQISEVIAYYKQTGRKKSFTEKGSVSTKPKSAKGNKKELV